MTRIRPVLLLNAVQHVSIALARSLHKRGIPVTVADVTEGACLPASRAIQKRLRLPSCRFEPGAFIEALVSLVRSGGYDTLLPSSDVGLVAVSNHYERLSALLYVGCPTPNIVERVLDKRLTLKTAEACGILTPATYTAEDVSALRKLQRTLPFPVIAKPITKMDETNHRFKLRYFANFQDLESAFLNDVHFGATYLLQDYCAGDGVGVELLLHNGEPVAQFQHRRIRELPPTGGGSVVCVSEPVDPLLRDQAVALLRQLGWEGVAMVEFRYDRRGRKAVLMEVNGRYWGSLPLAIHAGIDFPFYEWQLAHGQRPSVPKSYAAGLRCRWLVGDLRRIYVVLTTARDHRFPQPSKLKELLRFGAEFVTPGCGAMWSWSDPIAACNEIRCTGADAFRKVFRMVTRSIGKYRYYGLQTSCVLMRLRFLSALGLDRRQWPSDLAAIKSVVFVCEGNIIRSPMAEALLREYLKGVPGGAGISVCSAGLTSKLKECADERARAVAREFGVSLNGHQPRGLTPELIGQADAIFIMDYFNLAKLLATYPRAARKTFFLGAYSTETDSTIEIADPSNGTLGDVRECYRTVERHTRRLAIELCGADQIVGASAAARRKVAVVGEKQRQK